MPPPPRRRWLPYALAAVWLAAGYANLVRGVPHAGGDGYRAWAFAHHAYSDVIGLGGDRYLGGDRPVPYLQDRIEYPPLLALALWLPAFAPGGILGHFTVTYLFLAACLLAALLALERIPGAIPLWLGGTPALVYYAGLNWDLLPIALLAFGVERVSAALASPARPGPAAAGGGLAALGASAKLFPAVLAPPALGALAGRASRRIPAPSPPEVGDASARPLPPPGGEGNRRLAITRGEGGPRALVAFGAALCASWLAVNLPPWLAAPEAWIWFWRFNAARGAENSVWHALHLGRGPLLDALSTLPLLGAALLATWGAFAAGRRGGDAARAVRLGTALALAVWIATNKIWSPQYALYGFLAAALAAAPGGLSLPLVAISAADYHAAFEVRALRWPPGFTEGVFHPVGIVRTALWLGLAAWIARALWREARGEISSRAAR